ncbi:MAG: hypothetical protein P1U42_08690 [Phycisphaerales bacterium]|nr:hypothetical protein [Phycisphaerales bacterium]
MKKYITTLAVATCAASAMPVDSSAPISYSDPESGELICAATIDISGSESWDIQGSAINDILPIFLGSGLQITGLSWDVNLTTYGASWGSEANFLINDQVTFNPGIGDDFSVSNAHYSSGGIINFADLGIPDIVIGGDGILRLEFYESFDDVQGQADAIWLPGSTITFYTQGWPTPGTASALAFTGLIVSRRKRH